MILTVSVSEGSKPLPHTAHHGGQRLEPSLTLDRQILPGIHYRRSQLLCEPQEILILAGALVP